jgi:hypothetical protein
MISCGLVLALVTDNNAYLEELSRAIPSAAASVHDIFDVSIACGLAGRSMSCERQHY